MALPAAPGPNAAYTAVSTPLRFRLTVTGVKGATSTSEAVVRPSAEALTVGSARYRTRGEWRVSGTSDLKVAQRVAIVLGSEQSFDGQRRRHLSAVDQRQALLGGELLRFLVGGLLRKRIDRGAGGLLGRLREVVGMDR